MYDVREFGAVGDGTTDDTAAVQAAVDACAAAGGGRVLLPGGHTFRTGTVTLLSHVELHLEHGATLAGSPDFADYTVRFGGVVLNDGNTQWGKEPTGVLLNAEGAENIAVTGAGTIDGAGRHFVLSDNGHIYTMDQKNFPAMPTDGFHLENAHDVRLCDCEVVWRARPDDARHALYAEGCPDLENRDFRGDAAQPGLEAVLTR